MTASEFNNLSFHEKGDVLFKSGSYCGLRDYYGFRLNLYSLFGFFVEVYYEPIANKIDKIEIVTDDKILDRYIDSMIKLKSTKSK